MPKRTWILEILRKNAYLVRARFLYKDAGKGQRRKLVTRLNLTPELFDDFKDLVARGCDRDETLKVIDKSWQVYE